MDDSALGEEGLTALDPTLGAPLLRVTSDAGGVLHLVGEADMSTEDVLRRGIEAMVRGSARCIDLSELRFVDARCLGILIAASLDGGGPVVLLAPRPNVLRVFDVLGVTSSGALRIEGR